MSETQKIRTLLEAQLLGWHLLREEREQADQAGAVFDALDELEEQLREQAS